MSTILALDVGDKFIGLAVADAKLRIPLPLGVIPVAQAQNRILDIIKERTIEHIVVGLPLGESGERNKQCSKIENFCRRLKRRTPVPIQFIDEYYSSYEAEEHQRAGQGGSKKGKQRVDDSAATIILQRFFDTNAGIKSPL